MLMLPELRSLRSRGRRQFDLGACDRWNGIFLSGRFCEHFEALLRGRNANTDFENLVKLGIELSQDSHRDTLVPQIRISGRLESELNCIFFPIKAF